jgi:hypothetical protein
MMHQVKFTSLLLSLSLLCLGVLAGWLITTKAAGPIAASQFVHFGIYFSALVFLVKVWIYMKARRLLLFQIIFIGGFGLDVAWVFSCLFLPLIWLPTINTIWKAAIVIAYAVICAGNVRLAIRLFDEKWERISLASFENTGCSSRNADEWKLLVKPMRISATIFLPGIPARFSDLISILCLALMIVGFIFRGISPVVSMLFLGLPFSICAGCCLQMSAYHFSEATRLAMFEKKRKVAYKAS